MATSFNEIPDKGVVGALVMCHTEVLKLPLECVAALPFIFTKILKTVFSFLCAKIT